MANVSSTPPESRQSPQPAAKIAIVTDSVAQVPAERARQLGIRVVPSTIIVEGNKFLDGVDFNANGLYQRMRTEKNLVLSTSAPSAGQFFAVFKECLEAGADSVLYVGLSSRMSGTYSAAEGGAILAREEFGSRQITLFDTRIATIAQGFLAIEAAQLASQGADLEHILGHLNEERKHIGLVASLETLEYLARGGRIGKAAYMLGSAINILPVVSFGDDGVVLPIQRVRGHHRALVEMVSYVSTQVAGCRSLKLAVMHADALAQAEALQAMAVEALHPDEIFITHFTPVMAAHAGPGMIGLAYHWHP